MNDQHKKPAIGGFSDMMEISEKKFAQKEKGGDELKKNERSLERKNEQKKEITKERTLRHHSFDVFVDQLISLDQIRTRIFQEKGKKPKISTLVQEAFDTYIKYHTKERTNE
jgi:soluble cytochrome b562